MYAAKATAVHKNPTTQAAIRRQLVKQGLLPPPPTQEEIAQKLTEAYERKWEEHSAHITRLEQARQRDAGPHTMRYIARWICLMHGITIEDLRCNRRPAGLSHARKQFAYWAYRLTSASYPQIAFYLDKDHSTVIYGAKTYRASKKKVDPWLRKKRGR